MKNSQNTFKVIEGITPIFLEKISFPCTSNHGQAKAIKNITFPMKFVLLQVHRGYSHLVANNSSQTSLSCRTTSYQHE